MFLVDMLFTQQW